MPIASDTIAPHEERDAERALGRERRAGQQNQPKGNGQRGAAPSRSERGSPLAARPETQSPNATLPTRPDASPPGQARQQPNDQQLGKGGMRNTLQQWRQMRQRIAQAEALRQNAKTAEQEKNRSKKLREASQKITGQALKQAWLNLIPSWGATILWIDLHYVMSELGGPLTQYFCPMGHEWEFLKFPMAKNLGRICEIVLMVIANVVVVVVIALLILTAIIGFCISPAGIAVCGAIAVDLGIQGTAF